MSNQASSRKPVKGTKELVPYKLNIERSVYNAALKRAKANNRSFAAQLTYACKVDAGMWGDCATIVVGDIGELLLLPSGQYLHLDSRTFKRFCKRYLPPYAIERWDTEFESLGEAVSACGEPVAVMTAGGIVVQDFELWDKLYHKYL